jgi:predicted alpha/beta-hydrolase family hydrolase
MTTILTDGAPDAKALLLLGHGAGAPMTSPFLEKLTGLLVERGLQVARFEFGYMAARREGGKKRPPPRAETLMPEYLGAVKEMRGRLATRLFIGGKSMGGRVASLVADGLFADKAIAGLVCLGYPFHPPGKPDALRTAHLETMRCPTLIVQGERDPFGSRAEVEALKLPASIRFVWIADGDHDFGPRGGSGFTRAGNLAAAADAVSAFTLGAGGQRA